MKYIFGPVPSRRLGMSLGVDIIPFKTCTLDCIYCQLGVTTKKVIERENFVPQDEVLAELKQVLNQDSKRIDFITFSGSGEPTLNSQLGEMIANTKTFTDVPIAVITNGSLLYRDDVRNDLIKADLVVPSLDAMTDETLRKVNRHNECLNAKLIIDGLRDFTQEYKGKIWLEIMLVKGVNDDLDEIKEMAEFIRSLKLDKIHLNTVIRPPAEDFAQPITSEEIQKITSLFDDRVEIIADFDKIVKTKKLESFEILEAQILSLVNRRPCTLDDISTSTGLHHNEIVKHLDHLLQKGLIKQTRRDNKIYWLV
ncbi:TPA: radical SAM protein [bacterium]|nr:radical SAM protein [bacterium]